MAARSMKSLQGLSLILLLVLTSCGTYYQDVPSSGPHATLHFSDSHGLLRAQSIIPLSINGVPANSGRWDLRSFSVRPGPITLVVIRDESSQRPSKVARCRLEFDAVADERYEITGTDGGDSFTFAVKDTQKRTVVARQVAKESVSYRPLYTPPVVVPVKK